jgi:hypothetical protein
MACKTVATHNAALPITAAVKRIFSPFLPLVFCKRAAVIFSYFRCMLAVFCFFVA